MLLKCLCEKKESRDSVDGGGYGDSTSMILGEGEKPSGEAVSFSLLLLLYYNGPMTDQQHYYQPIIICCLKNLTCS